MLAKPVLDFAVTWQNTESWESLKKRLDGLEHPRLYRERPAVVYAFGSPYNGDHEDW